MKGTRRSRAISRNIQQYKKTPLTSALVPQVIKLLRKLDTSIGFAESCTGGLFSSTLTSFPGVSDIFVGSVVSYSPQIKSSLLMISEKLLKKKGAVHPDIALLMARGARKVLNVPFALSVTGYAGPIVGHPTIPIGTIYLAVVGPNLEIVEKHQLKGTRKNIQKRCVNLGFNLMFHVLLSYEKDKKRR